MKRWALRITGSVIGLLLLLLLAIIAAYGYLSTRTNGTLISLGEQRDYLLHVPATYDATLPAPLVISLHGAYLYPRFQMLLSKWSDLADTEGFIVVYPKASGLLPLWRMSPGDDLVAETQFFRDLIDKLSAEYNIDSSRIYLSGYSNGAAMAIMLSCSLPGRFAAFGMIATPVVPASWCDNAAPAPLIAVHGIKDPFALYDGGENFLTTEPLPTIQQWVSLWAARNRCETSPVDTELAGQVALRRYENCEKGASVTLYSLAETGHVWPGGMRFPGNFAGPNSDSIDATREMWLFFREHPLPP